MTATEPLRPLAGAPRNFPPPHDPLPTAALQLTPLQVAGVVVRKAALVRALRVYVPHLRDIQMTDDGEVFWLLVHEGEEGEHDADPAAAVG